ncbi:MAG: hypothetical protein KFE23_00360 [Candidatus Baumannia cicadellinicola]|nr:hypothetical protein [Candidatus Baumannia cicadellinicola]
MEHDIFYAKHRDTNSRHIADKVLQDKAMDRFLSKDASLGERFVALPTAGAMFLKRKLGMGIEENLKF